MVMRLLPLLLLPPGASAAHVLAGITAFEGGRSPNWTTVSFDFDENGDNMRCTQTIKPGGPPFEAIENSAVSPSGLFTLEDVANDGVAVAAYDAGSGRLLGKRHRLKPESADDALFFGLGYSAAEGLLASVVLDYPTMAESGAHWIDPAHGNLTLAVGGLHDLAFRSHIAVPGASAFDPSSSTLYQVVAPRTGAAGSNGTLGLLTVGMAARRAALVSISPQQPGDALLSTVFTEGGGKGGGKGGGNGSAILGLYASGEGASRTLRLVSVEPGSGAAVEAGAPVETGDETFDALVVMGAGGSSSEHGPAAGSEPGGVGVGVGGLVVAATQADPLGRQAATLYVWELRTGRRHRCALRAPVSMLHEVRSARPTTPTAPDRALDADRAMRLHRLERGSGAL